MQTETEDKEVRFAPRWETGDRWRVRYRRLGPNPAKQKDAPPKVYESVWEYRVDELVDDAIHVSARPDDDATAEWHIVFGTNGRTRSVNSQYGDVVPPIAETPVLTLAEYPSERVLPAWPRFPIEEDFGPDGGSFTQCSKPSEEGYVVTIRREGSTCRRTWYAPWCSVGSAGGRGGRQ